MSNNALAAGFVGGEYIACVAQSAEPGDSKSLWVRVQVPPHALWRTIHSASAFSNDSQIGACPCTRITSNDQFQPRLLLVPPNAISDLVVLSRSAGHRQRVRD